MSPRDDDASGQGTGPVVDPDIACEGGGEGDARAGGDGGGTVFVWLVVVGGGVCVNNYFLIL